MRPFSAYRRRLAKLFATARRGFQFFSLTAPVFAIFAATIYFLCSCQKKSETEESNQSPTAGQTPQASATPPLPPRRNAIWKDFNGERALDTAKSILRFGQRISGTEPLNQLRSYISEELKRSGWQAEEQRFTEQTPSGRQIEFCSLVAHSGRLPVITPRLIVVAHLDTIDLGIASDLGATDGAANTAILIEIARTLAIDPRLAAHIELLFLDGHMPFRQIGPQDGLFGSRFYTQALRINQHTMDVHAAISLENLGERTATLAYPPNSDSGLIEQFRTAAEELGVKLEAGTRPLLLDHVPFREAGIPAIALFDANSPILNTADDTGDHLGSEALAKAGYLVLYILSKQITDQR
jgi:glutaminyl-peptide cyclotransferase